MASLLLGWSQCPDGSLMYEAPNVVPRNTSGERSSSESLMSAEVGSYWLANDPLRWQILGHMDCHSYQSCGEASCSNRQDNKTVFKSVNAERYISMKQHAVLY